MANLYDFFATTITLIGPGGYVNTFDFDGVSLDPNAIGGAGFHFIDISEISSIADLNAYAMPVSEEDLFTKAATAESESSILEWRGNSLVNTQTNIVLGNKESLDGTDAIVIPNGDSYNVVSIPGGRVGNNNEFQTMDFRISDPEGIMQGRLEAFLKETDFPQRMDHFFAEGAEPGTHAMGINPAKGELTDTMIRAGEAKEPLDKPNLQGPEQQSVNFQSAPQIE